MWHQWRDRKSDLPRADTKALSGMEQRIQNAVNLTIRDAEREYAHHADPLEAERDKLVKERDKFYLPDYEKLQQKLGRYDVLVYISKPTHLVLLALLTIGEMAFNLVAFNVMREPGLYTVLMALAVAFAIPICAWATGVWVRQWPPPWWKTALKLLVVITALAAVLVGINRVRIAYLQERSPEFVARHPELSTAFFAVNIIILVAAALVTYLAHDPEPGFEDVKRRLDRCQRRLHWIEGRLDQLANQFRIEADMLKEHGWQLMAYYRMLNRRGRQKVPNYFDDPADPNHKPPFVDVDVAQFHTGASGQQGTPSAGGASAGAAAGGGQR